MTPQQPASLSKPFWIRLMWFLLPLALAVGVVAFLFNNPQITFSSVHQFYQQGSTWVETPHLGEPSYHFLIAPDGAVWGMNTRGLYRWDGSAWQTIYTPQAHPTDFQLSGTTLWLVTHGDLVRCDTTTLTCEAVQTINQGLSIAVWGNQVYAITRGGELVWFDGQIWSRDSLGNLLPGFDASQEELIPELLFTDDGTLWLMWYRLWRYTGTWEAVHFGDTDTTGIRLTGATPGILWTEWGDGLAAARPNLTQWQFFTWEEMQAPGSDWIFDLTSAPDGTIWVAAKNGLLHFDGSTWTMLALPDNPLVTALAITPDSTIWVQTTDSGVMAWLPLLAVMLGLILLVRWSGNRFMRSVTPRPA